MRELFKKVKKYNINYSDVKWEEYALYISKELCEEYKNIPLDIMRYFFVRHSNQADEIIDSIQPINAYDIKVTKIVLKNEEILNKDFIDNASFTSYGEPIKDDKYKDVSYNWYKDYYFKSGTWEYPIIAIRQDNKYIVIDGTNRLHHLRQCLLYNYDFIKSEHEIYLLN